MARASASCRGCRRPRGCRPRTRSTSSARRERSHRASRSSCRCCRASPISTISIRSAWSRTCGSTFVRPGEPIPGDADLVILPGSKSTIGDLAFLRAQGWDIDIKAHVRRGGHVLGLCGGYQMLGRSIADPLGIEGPAGTVDGLGLLDVDDRDDRATNRPPRCEGRHCATGAAVSGYEIHLGRTEGPDCARPVLTIGDRPDGAASRRRTRAGHLCARAVHVR